jgi:hypothetical protein
LHEIWFFTGHVAQFINSRGWRSRSYAALLIISDAEVPAALHQGRPIRPPACARESAPAYTLALSINPAFAAAWNPCKPNRDAGRQVTCHRCRDSSVSGHLARRRHAMESVISQQDLPSWSPEPPPKCLTNDEAARFLRLSPRTPEKQHVNGGGPRFQKFGRRVMCAVTDLEAWADARSFEASCDPRYASPRPVPCEYRAARRCLNLRPVAWRELAPVSRIAGRFGGSRGAGLDGLSRSRPG